MKLRQARQFAEVFQKARRSSDQHLTVLARSNGLQEPRLGMAISKKSASRSVDRSRIKRVVRESFRRNQSLLKGIDFVVLSKRGVATCKTHQLFDSLEKHWHSLTQ